MKILILAFIQNVSFSISSRARNRNNFTYHIVAATLANGVWFLTLQELVRSDMSFVLFIPYCVGTVFGSIFGVKFSMCVEKIIGASADAHINKNS